MKQHESSRTSADRVCSKTGTAVTPRRRGTWFVVLYCLTGLAALGWFLVRVLPKPSRAAYPCQRAALPVASSFVLWVAGLTGSLFAFKKSGTYLRRSRYGLAALCVWVGIVALCWSLTLPDTPARGEWIPWEPANSPLGTAKGIHPGRVVWVHNPEATSWDGSSNYWWSDVYTDQAAVDRMVSAGIRRLTGASDDRAAWEAVFRHFNRTHDRGDVGYQAGEGIAIKINMNVSGSYGRTNGPIASPQAVRALLRQLVYAAGVTESAIAVYDASRCISDPVYDHCHPEFPGVLFVDNDGLHGRVRAEPEDSVPVYYSGPGAGASGTTRLPKCVVGSAYLTNMALLRGHSLAGVTLCAKNHFGSVWRPDTDSDRGWRPSNLHTPIDKGRPMYSYNCLVDLMGHEHLGGKTLLFMIDALYAAVNQGSSRPSRWRSSPFDNDWTSSVFLSQDGVAIDSVALDFCRSEPALEGQVGGSMDNYLHEAALAGNPPSGTVYDPEGDGTPLTSLGTHEHWNNATDKQYSRNLETGDGIELVAVSLTAGFQRGDANADGRLDISDAVSILRYLFGAPTGIQCLSSADVNDTGVIDIADAVYLLSYLFAHGQAPPPPFGTCGEDPTPDALSCDSYPPCAG